MHSSGVSGVRDWEAKDVGGRRSGPILLGRWWIRGEVMQSQGIQRLGAQDGAFRIFRKSSVWYWGLGT